MPAFTSLNVTVLDVNDNAPDFQYDSIPFNGFRIAENRPAHTPVFKASAKDKDIGENAKVSKLVYTVIIFQQAAFLCKAQNNEHFWLLDNSLY